MVINRQMTVYLNGRPTALTPGMAQSLMRDLERIEYQRLVAQGVITHINVIARHAQEEYAQTVAHAQVVKALYGHVLTVADRAALDAMRHGAAVTMQAALQESYAYSRDYLDDALSYRAPPPKPTLLEGLAAYANGFMDGLTNGWWSR